MENGEPELGIADVAFATRWGLSGPVWLLVYCSRVLRPCGRTGYEQFFWEQIGKRFYIPIPNPNDQCPHYPVSYYFWHLMHDPLTTPLVAIVILNWNGKHHLEQFLPSVLATAYGRLVVVVADNASTDDSVAFLQRQYPQVHLLQLEQNYGFAKGYNEALKRVEADYYVLLNSDVEVTPNWLQPLLQVLEAKPNAAACQPKVLAWKNKRLFEYAGAAGGWLDAYGYPFARGRVLSILK